MFDAHPRRRAATGALLLGGAALVLALPRAALADPPVVASARYDLDGDGTLDSVELDANGMLSAMYHQRDGGRRGRTRQVLGGAIANATLTVASSRALLGPAPVALLVADVAERGGGAPRREALAFAIGRTPTNHPLIEDLWREPIGRIADGVTRRAEVSAAGGLRSWDERGDLARCDGTPLELAARRFDPARRAMRPVAARLAAPTDAPTLIAQPVGGAFAARVLAFRAAAASSRRGGEPGDPTAAPELVDGDPSTAWIEGKGGAGKGERVVVRALLDGGPVRELVLVPGAGGDRARLRGHNRLRRALVQVGDRAFWLELGRDPADGAPGAAYRVVLPTPVEASCASLAIAAVWPGADRGDSAIAELAVLTSLELAPDGGAAGLAALVASGGRGAVHAARALAALGGPGEAALVAALPAATGAARRRIVRALAAIPAAPDALVAALREDLEAGDARAIEAALARLGAPAAIALGALLADDRAEVAARVHAAAALGALPATAAVERLIAQLGVGPAAVRRAASAALVGRRDVLDALLGLAATETSTLSRDAEADLWRTLLTMAAAYPEIRPPIAVIARQRLAGPTLDYALATRMASGVPWLGDDDARRALERSLAVAARALPPHQAIAIERVLAAALGESGDAAGRAALRGKLERPDPGVREAAAEALGALGDPRDAGALAGRLAGDRWPRVRERAAAALARPCRGAGPARAALERALAGDPAVPVRRAALAALVRCAPPDLADRVLRVAADAAQPTELRRAALDHAARLDGGPRRRALTTRLVALFEELRAAAWNDESVRPLAAGLAVALGRRGDRAALPALELALAEGGAFPALQAAAATALGAFCPPAARAALGDLAADGEPAVAIAARGTLARCWGRSVR
jgi:HEAT repeat protein